jgi:hypothetical protein
MNLFPIPGKRVELFDDPCQYCQSIEFVLIENGPHIQRQCANCGELLGFVKRAKVGEPERDLKREPIGHAKRMEILQRWNHRCAWCGIPATEVQLHVGHILPRGKVVPLYGSALADDILNLAPTCEVCNAGAHLTSRLAVNLLMCSIRIGAKK